MILLLSGANDFAIRQALDQVIDDFVYKHGAHAVERIDGEQFDAARLPELVQGASLFASHRLVILRDASKQKALWEALGEWVSRVPVEVVLVMIEAAPDKRTRTYKHLQAHGKVHEFAELTERELTNWLQAQAKQQGGSLDAHTATYLVRRVGLDQWRLHTELQKLLIAGPGITVALIDALVEPQPQASAFELLDAVLGGEAQQVKQLIIRLKASEDAHKLFGLLVSQIQTLALVVTAQGKAAELIAKEAGVHPFVVRKMQPLARRLNYEQLQTIISTMALTDTQLKSTGIEPWTLLEQCLGKIAAISAR